MTDIENSFVSDLGSGLTDLELMDKYRISAAELRKRLLNLIRQGAVDSHDVYWRPILYDYGAEGEDKRSSPRYPLKKLLPVVCIDCPQLPPGFLVDINEKGGCVMGLGVRAGERITIAVRPENLIDVDEIRLEALFKWAEADKDIDVQAAGFEIYAIDPKNFVLLKELIREIIVKT